ncbi:hypothetical protein BD770DRAFT_414056 [Pilaira anomala]|nr:hypothetical protein BD770DRAFT_414056 [Pilaira anomala]
MVTISAAVALSLIYFIQDRILKPSRKLRHISYISVINWFPKANNLVPKGYEDSLAARFIFGSSLRPFTIVLLVKSVGGTQLNSGKIPILSIPINLPREDGEEAARRAGENYSWLPFGNVRKFTWTTPENSKHKNRLINEGFVIVTPVDLDIVFCKIY